MVPLVLKGPERVLWSNFGVVGLTQHDQTGGARATSGPRPFVIRLAKLYVNLLLQDHLLSTLKDLKTDSYLVCRFK
jgi:hypothetical protein